MLRHSESDSIFESFSEDEVRWSLEQGCDDVTGIKYFEQLHAARHKERHAK